MGKLLTIKDIESRLNISHSTAYKILKIKNFPCIQIGKQYYIPEDKFEKWISDHIGQKIEL